MFLGHGWVHGASDASIGSRLQRVRSLGSRRGHVRSQATPTTAARGAWVDAALIEQGVEIGSTDGSGDRRCSAVALTASLASCHPGGITRRFDDVGAHDSVEFVDSAGDQLGPARWPPTPADPGGSQSHPRAAAKNAGPAELSQITPTHRSAPGSPSLGAALAGAVSGMDRVPEQRAG